MTASELQPAPRDPRRPFASSAFSKLARTHALSVGGDALFAIALAGSVFFSLDFDSARWKVALYLLLTIAPFAVAAPLIGPALDRIAGGRRWVIFGSVALRAVLCFLVIRHMDSILFYPEAFLMLVLGKTYTISKSAIVPTTVRTDQELIEANSKLTVLSALAVVVVAPLGGALLKLGGPGWTLGLATIIFGVATVAAFQLPDVRVAAEKADAVEKLELRSRGIRLAASAMGLVRGIVGFLSFMLAFSFKEDDAPLWHLGLAAGAAQLGFFVGAVIVPRMRRIAEEERILQVNLLVACVGGFVCFALGGLPGAIVLSMVVGATSSAAKQAFDAIVQQDAPDANRGRSFAKFETRFQLFWVIGALIPIVIPIPAEIGFLIVALIAGFAVVAYFVGRRNLGRSEEVAQRIADRAGPGPHAPRSGPDAGDTVLDAPSLTDPTTVAGPDLTEVRTTAPVDPTGRNPRPWSRRSRTESTTEWSPPEGFVEQPLTDEPIVPDAAVDPSLPKTVRQDSPFDDLAEGTPLFEETEVVPTEPDELGTEPLPFDEPTHVYPDPPWRS